MKLASLRSLIVSALQDAPRDPDERRRFFEGRPGNRYWWHRLTKDEYLPDAYAILSEEEWDVLRAWFEETDRRNLIGECSVPLISWLCTFVSSNNVSRVVQLGTYSGYSTLLLGWTLRRSRKRRALVAVDIDKQSWDFAGEWTRRAGLSEQVHFHLGDSADPNLPAKAAEYLGGAPQLVFIDSSHQYEHTLRELDLWYGALQPGGVIVLHDTSEAAVSYDATAQGGVHRAFSEWRARSPANSFNLAFPRTVTDSWQQVYRDGCGLGLVVKS
jgi:predicted O-methyltransferase YrrM